MSEWISVDDKIPAGGEGVFGWIAPYGIIKGGVAEPVTYECGDWYDLAGRTCTVTHWMPLPAPPK